MGHDRDAARMGKLEQALGQTQQVVSGLFKIMNNRAKWHRQVGYLLHALNFVVLGYVLVVLAKLLGWL